MMTDRRFKAARKGHDKTCFADTPSAHNIALAAKNRR